MRRYFEFYEYDEVGNILKFDHKAHSGNWIRAYEYDEASLIEPGKKSNRLSRTGQEEQSLKSDNCSSQRSRSDPRTVHLRPTR
jgi:hypothetical protein